MLNEAYRIRIIFL